MALLRNGPDLWADLLEDIVPIFGGDSIVAGGAVRDFDLGLQPKDIDIWVNCPQPQAFAHLVARLQATDGNFAWGLDLIEENVQTDYDGEALGDGMIIYEGLATHLDIDCPVNLIFHPDHQRGQVALVERFDMDICQGWFSAGFINRTAAMQQALLKKTATATREGEIERTIKRFDRFNARNPGVLTFVNPFQGDLPL